jgi:3-hydroxybutyryl-CoA dehydrogenase
MAMLTNPVAVVGAGTMGHGIAYVAALAGHDTALGDSSEGALASAKERIDSLFARARERGRIDAAAEAAARARLRFTHDPGDAGRGAGIVIEAIPENLDLKRDFFRFIEKLVPANAILATNTSALSVADIATVLARPERFIGLHFFNPVPAMKLLELVRAPATSEAVVEAARAFGLGLGKTPIVVRDSPGFATSRLGIVLGLEAMRMVEEGVASAEDIDKAMELGYGHAAGPLRTSDLVGLDV